LSSLSELTVNSGIHSSSDSSSTFPVGATAATAATSGFPSFAAFAAMAGVPFPYKISLSLNFLFKITFIGNRNTTLL